LLGLLSQATGLFTLPLRLFSEVMGLFALLLGLFSEEMWLFSLSQLKLTQMLGLLTLPLG
jgi:hypothetical protein